MQVAVLLQEAPTGQLGQAECRGPHPEGVGSEPARAAEGALCFTQRGKRSLWQVVGALPPPR